jgi:demethylmenaquinone methyltransferase/2-methoxy-6-polyprenyl-1,4-benzoquinol methylase
MRQIYLWYFLHVLPKIGQWIAPNRESAYHYLPTSVGQFDQGEMLLERMKQAGLRDLRAQPMTFGTVTLYRGKKGTRSKQRRPPSWNEPRHREEGS